MGQEYTQLTCAVDSVAQTLYPASPVRLYKKPCAVMYHVLRLILDKTAKLLGIEYPCLDDGNPIVRCSVDLPCLMH